MKAFTSSEVLEVYLNALAHVYDPHSDYLGHEEMESFAIADESLARRHRRVAGGHRRILARFASSSPAGPRREAGS